MRPRDAPLPHCASLPSLPVLGENPFNWRQAAGAAWRIIVAIGSLELGSTYSDVHSYSEQKSGFRDRGECRPGTKVAGK